MSKTSTDYTLWGFNQDVPAYRVPIKITGGSLRHCRADQRMRQNEGWTFGTYQIGDEPTGLRLQAMPNACGASNGCGATAGQPCTAGCPSMAHNRPGWLR